MHAYFLTLSIEKLNAGGPAWFLDRYLRGEAGTDHSGKVQRDTRLAEAP